MSYRFYFDFGSPNAYLAHTRIPGVEGRTGARIEYVPALLGGMRRETVVSAPDDLR